MNKRRSLLSMTGAVVALVALSGSVMAADPVIFENGSFETGAYVAENFAPWDFDRVEIGQTDIAGWDVTKGNVDWVRGDWHAAQGTMSIDLDGAENTAGAISHTFDTVVNGTYFVAFSMSGNPGAAPTIKTMSVDAAGKTQDYTYNTASNDFAHMNWAPKDFTFVAKSTHTTLTFTSTTGTGWGPAIDNIVVTQTLATGANCKKGGWESMVDKNGTSFRNQGDCVSYYATGEKNLASGVN